MKTSSTPTYELTKKILFACIIVGLALFVYRYHSKAFPEFSLNSSLKKSLVTEKADGYARIFGLDPAIYHKSLTFSERTEDKFFLEREYGLERLKAEVDAGVSIWYWNVRNFIPGEKEEFSIKLSPDGNLVGFNHLIEETTPRPKLTKDQALRKAEQFIDTYITQHPRKNLELTESGEEEKPGYYIYTFTWKRTDWTWGKGLYHLHLRVDGNQVGRYYEHLKEPEEWRRDFAQKRSVNKIYAIIAWTAATLLALGVFMMFIRTVVRDRKFWHHFPLKWTIPFGLLFLIASLSGFPSLLSQYSTLDNFHVFITDSLIATAFSTLGTIMAFVIVAFMADVFWQKSFPVHVSVRSLLNGKGLATREAMRAVPLGFALALAALAYVTAYYLLGSRFDIWTPSSIDYSRVVTSYFPALEALAIGVKAAWIEELFFRILAIVLIFRVTKSKWLAIIVSATVWGFMHSNYPQLPGYARGVELTLEGILYGWIAVRFGILTTFISHCLFNTWLGAIFAWRIGSPFHMVMAVFVSIWPIALWGAAKIKVSRLGRFISPVELLSTEAILAEKKHEDQIILAVKHRKPKTSIVLGSTLAVAAMFLVLSTIPDPPLADLGAVSLTPHTARDYADTVFKNKTDLDPALFHRTVQYYADITEADTEYLLEHTDQESLADQIRNSLYQEYWQVDYFQAEERNTYSVSLDSEGKLLLFSRSIGEDEPGAELEQDEAVALATSYLQERLAISPDQFKMVSYNMIQKPNRRDHAITFESTDWNIGESKLRWSISILSDAINGFGSHINVPEKYTRKKMALGWQDAVNGTIDKTNSFIMTIGFIALFIALLKGRHINWRQSLLLGFPGLLLAIIVQANQLNDFYLGYRTTQTMMNFFIGRGIGILMVLVMAYLLTAFFFAILSGLVRWFTGINAVPALLGSNLKDTRQRFTQGVGIGLLAWAVLWGAEQTLSFLHSTISSADLLTWNSFDPIGFSTGLSYLTTALSEALINSLATGSIVLVLIFLGKKKRGYLIFGLFILILNDMSISWQSSLDAIYTICFHVLVMLLELWLLLRLIRFNAYGYFFFYYYQALLPSALTMSFKGWPAYSTDISLLWAAAIAPLLMAVLFKIIPSVFEATPVLESRKDKKLSLSQIKN